MPNYKSPTTADRLSVVVDSIEITERSEYFDRCDAKGREYGMRVRTWTLYVGLGPTNEPDYCFRSKRQTAIRMPVGAHYAAELQTTRGGPKYGAYTRPVYFTNAAARDAYVAKRIAAAQARAHKSGGRFTTVDVDLDDTEPDAEDRMNFHDGND